MDDKAARVVAAARAVLHDAHNNLRWRAGAPGPALYIRIELLYELDDAFNSAPATMEDAAEACIQQFPRKDQTEMADQQLTPGPRAIRAEEPYSQFPIRVKFTKQMRLELDAVLQKLKPAAVGSRERALAITKIQEAIMWLGMDLKELAGGVSCYEHGYDPSNATVDPPPDDVKL